MLWLSGWAFDPTVPVRQLEAGMPDGEAVTLEGYGLPSEDVALVHGPVAENCRFSSRLTVGDPQRAMRLRLFVRLENGERHELEGFSQRRRAIDPLHMHLQRFLARLKDLSGGGVLEIGSRSRSGITRRDLVPGHLAYLGLDIVPGENVDVVGDVHELSRLFPAESFDAILGFSVFEHLMMPWKAAIEMNHVLKPGGLVWLATHQTWPIHDAPCDFFRFSDSSWRALFNGSTGFEILETALGEPASVVAHWLQPDTRDLDRQPAYLSSAVLCRKIGACQLSWDVEPSSLAWTSYPV